MLSSTRGMYVPGPLNKYSSPTYLFTPFYSNSISATSNKAEFSFKTYNLVIPNSNSSYGYKANGSRYYELNLISCSPNLTSFSPKSS